MEGRLPAEAPVTGSAAEQQPCPARNPPRHGVWREEVKLQHLHAPRLQHALEVEARAALRGHNGGRVPHVPQLGLRRQVQRA